MPSPLPDHMVIGGYLPAQFVNPRTNLRDDAYGGDFERRLRFLRDVLSTVRAAAPGLRIFGDEMDSAGLGKDLVAEVCAALAGDLDYTSVVAGTSASLGGSLHITPPMGLQPG